MRSTVVWRVLVPVVLLLIGLLVATSARLATGTDLRAERRTDLVDLIRAEQQRVEAETNTVTAAGIGNLAANLFGRASSAGSGWARSTRAWAPVG